MDIFAHEAIRCLACCFGAATFAVMQPQQSYRAWFALLLPGLSFGVFLAPEVCKIASATWSWSWLDCGSLSTDCAVGIVVSFFANTAAKALLLSAERLFPEWVWGSVRRLLGIPETSLPEPRILQRPDSDPPLAR